MANAASPRNTAGTSKTKSGWSETRDVTGWDVDQYAARELIDSVPVGVTIHDSSHPDTPVVYANARFCSLTGYDRTALEALPLARLLAPTTDRERVGRVAGPLDTSGGVSAVLETVRADGSTFPNHVRAAPLGDGHTLLVHDDLSDAHDPDTTLDWTDRPVTAQGTTVDLAAVSEACWRTVTTDRAELVIQTDRRVRADPRRLAQLLSALFHNAVEHGDAWRVTVGELDGGFYVGDDGSGLPEAERTSPFDTDGGLGTCQQVAEFHGWELTAARNHSGGARFEVSGVDLVRHSNEL